MEVIPLGPLGRSARFVALACGLAFTLVPVLWVASLALRPARALRHAARRHPGLRRRDHAARDLAHGRDDLADSRTSRAGCAYRWRRVRDDGTPDPAAARHAGRARGRDARVR